jgi:thiamine biosynthesis protein ThiS
MTRVVVNGEERPLGRETTVRAMLEAFGLKPDGHVVQLNGEIIGQAGYGQCRLRDGDRLEIISFMAGG